MGNNKSIFTTISSLLEEKINDKEYINRSKKRETDFSRNRKLSFADYMVLLLKRSKKGLQPALNEFCRETKTFATEYSKQAFSKGRERIRPEAIQELFEDTVAGFYSTATYKTLKGYRVSAIDGTDYNLPYTDQLMEKFGSEKFAHNLVQVQALGSCLYDVLNGYLIDATLERFDANERVCAKNHLQKLVQLRTDKELVLFDRGYPSAELLCFMEENNIKYLMRCTKENFFREIRDFSGTDGYVVRQTIEKKNLEIRVLCYENGYTLITNLGCEEFSKEELYDLYHKRWAIETKYNDIKNKMKIEQFSGISSIAIYQDFWATMTLSNLASALEFDATLMFEKNRKKSSHLRKKQINRAVLLNALKDEFVWIFAHPSKRKRKQIVSRITKQISKSLIDIVPNRHFPRALSRSAKRFNPTAKSLS